MVILVHKETFSPSYARALSHGHTRLCSIVAAVSWPGCAPVQRPEMTTSIFFLSLLSLFLRAHVDMGTRLFAHAYRVVLDLSSSTHPFPPSFFPPLSLPLPPSLPLSLCGEQKEETLLLDVFFLQQV